MNARQITEALGGKWHGSYGTARCPAHKDRTPSLSIKDGYEALLLKCHAGCDIGDIISELKRRSLWDAKANHGSYVVRLPKRQEPDTSHNRNRELALAIWNECLAAENTLVETYLRNRCITISPPPSLRYHPNLKHGPTGLDLPCMVVAVQDVAGNVVGIHRTYLDLKGHKAKVTSLKMALGPIGGGLVRLASAYETLAIAEGVEDGLALMQMTGQPVWAALGTSGFKNVVLPSTVKTVVLAPDADPAGDAVVGTDQFSGRRVLHLRPPDGCDWCDVLADFEERAAIREYDRGELRADAELAAFAEVVGAEVGDV